MNKRILHLQIVIFGVDTARSGAGYLFKDTLRKMQKLMKNMASSSDFVHNRHNQSILVCYLDLITILLFHSMIPRENYFLCTRRSVTIFNDRRDSSVDSTTNTEWTQTLFDELRHYLDGSLKVSFGIMRDLYI